LSLSHTNGIYYSVRRKVEENVKTAAIKSKAHQTPRNLHQRSWQRWWRRHRSRNVFMEVQYVLHSSW